eukprot:3949356-Pleurochrysis_carterae.AAC.1
MHAALRLRNEARCVEHKTRCLEHEARRARLRTHEVCACRVCSMRMQILPFAALSAGKQMSSEAAAKLAAQVRHRRSFLMHAPSPRCACWSVNLCVSTTEKSVQYGQGPAVPHPRAWKAWYGACGLKAPYGPVLTAFCWHGPQVLRKYDYSGDGELQFDEYVLWSTTSSQDSDLTDESSSKPPKEVRRLWRRPTPRLRA